MLKKYVFYPKFKQVDSAPMVIEAELHDLQSDPEMIVLLNTAPISAHISGEGNAPIVVGRFPLEDFEEIFQTSSDDTGSRKIYPNFDQI